MERFIESAALGYVALGAALLICIGSLGSVHLPNDPVTGWPLRPLLMILSAAFLLVAVLSFACVMRWLSVWLLTLLAFNIEVHQSGLFAKHAYPAYWRYLEPVFDVFGLPGAAGYVLVQFVLLAVLLCGSALIAMDLFGVLPSTQPFHEKKTPGIHAD